MQGIPWQIGRIILAVALPALALGGCGTYRGIPSHGGGKRFDEEQRIVANSVRKALADMDLKELKGKRVQIVLESIAADGGGTIIWPGLQSFSLGGSVGRNLYNNTPFSMSRNPDPNVVATFTPLQEDSTTFSGTGSMNVQVKPTYSPSVFSTQGDLSYLRACLEMKVRHEEIVPAADRIEAVLFVLVDVMGTNRSQTQKGFMESDDYEASCEMTYYAVDPATDKILLRQRQVSAVSNYTETRSLSGLEIDRQTQATTPMILPTDPTTRPASMPATAPAAATEPPPAAPPVTVFNVAMTQIPASQPTTAPTTAPASPESQPTTAPTSAPATMASQPVTTLPATATSTLSGMD